MHHGIKRRKNADIIASNIILQTLLPELIKVIISSLKVKAIGKRIFLANTM